MTSKNTNTKSSRELKKEVIEDLHQVENDLDRIERRLSPGQFIDEAIFQGKRRGPRETFDYLKKNPIGTTFLTMGTLLLMEDEDSHFSYEEMMRMKSSRYYSQTRDKVNSSLAQARSSYNQAMEKTQHLKDKVSSKFHKQETDYGTGYVEKTSGPSVGERLEDVKSVVSDKVQDVKDTLVAKGESVDSAKSRMREKLHGALDRTKASFSTANESLRGRGQEAMTIARNLDPLTYVALGASLGAITGATLPVSEREEAFMDQRLNLKFEEFKKDLKEALNQSGNSLKNDLFNDFKEFNFDFF